jgi:serine/threonine protein phosphatase PrpC
VTGLYIGFESVAQGDSHKENNLPCQDAVRHNVFADGGIAIVADGHGSEKHFRSDQGSKIAVDVAYDAISEFSRIIPKEKFREKEAIKDKFVEEQLRQLEGYIISRWRQRVLLNFDKHPLTEAEETICAEHNIDSSAEKDRVRMYGTTLIAAMIQTTWWFALQIGDGKCVVLDADENPLFPVPEDDNLGGGRTTSLCDANALESFRHVFGFDVIRGITVASDGVTDSFIPEKYLELHKRLYFDFCTDEKTANEGIQKSLPVWSSKGSRDDVSMAGIFYRMDSEIIDTEALKDVVPIYYKHKDPENTKGIEE